MIIALRKCQFDDESILLQGGDVVKLQYRVKELYTSGPVVALNEVPLAETN